MEIQEQLTASLAENNILKQSLENLNCEKVAIDLTLVESLKSSIQSKKESLLAQSQLQKFSCEIASLKSEKEEMQKKIDSLTNTIHRLGSDAQSSEG